MSEAKAARSRDLERLLTFVDAIVAVAITLLVLPLVDLATELEPGERVTDLISDHADRFWAFALSFAVILWLWLAQHRAMRDVIAADRVLVVSLCSWTLAIVFLPFPTALLPAAGGQALTKILYLGALAFCSLCLALVGWSVTRNPSLVGPGHRPSVRLSLAIAVLTGVALAIMLVLPATGYSPMVLLFLADPIERALARRG